MTSHDATDVLSPASRHNLHVTDREDLIGVGPWSQTELWRAVRQADDEGAVVVLDYDRERLYLAAAADVSYLPPTALGVAESPGLRVASPRPYDPENETAGAAGETVTVAPEFDVLVPAFDWEAPDEEWEPPEPEYRQRPTGSPSGAVGG